MLDKFQTCNKYYQIKPKGGRVGWILIMYKYKVAKPTKLRINQSVEGETIEMKMRRIVDNKEPITDGAPLIYGPKGEILVFTLCSFVFALCSFVFALLSSYKNHNLSLPASGIS